MTIYVDEAKWRFGRMVMCHMMTDGDLEELHDFAAVLGLQRRWFQAHPRHPHYDISKGKRALALRMGAKPVGSLELLRLCGAPSERI